MPDISSDVLLRQMAKEMDKMGLIEEMMDDAFEDMEDPEVRITDHYHKTRVTQMSTGLSHAYVYLLDGCVRFMRLVLLQVDEEAEEEVNRVLDEITMNMDLPVGPSSKNDPVAEPTEEDVEEADEDLGALERRMAALSS